MSDNRPYIMLDGKVGPFAPELAAAWQAAGEGVPCPRCGGEVVSDYGMMVCIDCHGIQDVTVPHDQVHAVERDIKKVHKFTVLQHALEFYGRCEKCE